jgi:myo-inositol catabolism protein IolC
MAKPQTECGVSFTVQIIGFQLKYVTWWSAWSPTTQGSRMFTRLRWFGLHQPSKIIDYGLDLWPRKRIVAIPCFTHPQDQRELR